ncbi:Hypothetical predicted protein, partial [Pelobates cultripes]
VTRETAYLLPPPIPCAPGLQSTSPAAPRGTSWHLMVPVFWDRSALISSFSPPPGCFRVRACHVGATASDINFTGMWAPQDRPRNQVWLPVWEGGVLRFGVIVGCQTLCPGFCFYCTLPLSTCASAQA